MSFISVSTSNCISKPNISYKNYVNDGIPNFEWHFFPKVNISIHGTIDGDVSKINPSGSLFRHISVKYNGDTRVIVNFDKQGQKSTYKDVLSILIIILIGETDLENGVNNGGNINGWAGIILISGHFG